MQLSILAPQRALFTAAAALCVLTATLDASAQKPAADAKSPAGKPAVPATAPVLTPRSAAQFDMTGNWVSIISEDWMFRMVIPPKGETGSVPVNEAGKKAAADWDPARDAPGAGKCRMYGAAGLMRVPGRLKVSWVDDRTLRLDFDAGSQTRLLHFAPNLPPQGYTASEPPTRLLLGVMGDPPPEPSLQGYSRAAWHKQAQSLGMGPSASTTTGARGGSLAVVTTRMLPGYLQSNGVPYSAEAILREFYDLITLPSGQPMLVVTSVVEDPAFLMQPWVTSTQFKREPDASKWDPSTC